MKISPSLAYALTVALHFSRAVALPDSTDEADVLSIPVADVLAKNLTPYQSHPLFGTYSNWTQTNEDVQALIANPNDPDVVSPNLIGVDCYPDSPLCFFSSSLKFNGTDEEWQSLVDTYEGPETPDDDESDTPDRMIKRAAKDRRASVHSKTYHRKGLGPSHGHEHYFDYNLKCKSLSYSSTGFQLVDHRVQYNNPGKKGVSSSVIVKEFHDRPFVTLRFRWIFECTLLSNSCCMKPSRQKVYREDGGGFSSPSTFECTKGSKVKAKCFR